jgi:hypothetical protein
MLAPVMASMASVLTLVHDSDGKVRTAVGDKDGSSADDGAPAMSAIPCLLAQ